MDLGLERVVKLLDALGTPSTGTLAPHRSFPIIHVAGTNGKGSICAYVASILTESGYAVGRYNSPHLVTPRDTIQINGLPISHTDFELANHFVKQKDAELNLKSTSFEILTAVAFYWFANCPRPESSSPLAPSGRSVGVDIAVIEVGVGGRLDATNIVDKPEICVIASIAMDHAGLLGGTLEAIAREKAGIMKAGVPVVVGPQRNLDPFAPNLDLYYTSDTGTAAGAADATETANAAVLRKASLSLEDNVVLRVMDEVAKKTKVAHLSKVRPAEWLKLTEKDNEREKTDPSNKLGAWAVLADGFTYWIPLQGDFQLDNSATALEVIRILREIPSDNPSDIAQHQQQLQAQGVTDPLSAPPLPKKWSLITNDSIQEGMKRTFWPGRLQWIHNSKGSTLSDLLRADLLVDGAHNPQAMVALRHYVDQYMKHQTNAHASNPLTLPPRVHWIMSFTQGKDIVEIFQHLFGKTELDGTAVTKATRPETDGAPKTPTSPTRLAAIASSKVKDNMDTVSIVEFTSPEGMPWVTTMNSDEVSVTLKQYLKDHVEHDRRTVNSFGLRTDETLRWVDQQWQEHDMVVVCGSLYLVADLLRMLQHPQPHRKDGSGTHGQLQSPGSSRFPSRSGSSGGGRSRSSSGH